METDPDPSWLGFFEISLKPISFDIIIGSIMVVLLLFFSAVISGSEVAFFSLSPSVLEKFKKNPSRKKKIILNLLDKADYLLATILVANNLINVAIVILASFLTTMVFDFSKSPTFGFIFQIVGITFILLLFGEIIPKLIANYRAISFAKFMALPLNIVFVLFKPITTILTRTSTVFNKIGPSMKNQISMDELSHAIELTDDLSNREEKILQGIVNFTNIEVKSIMRSRQNIISINTSENIEEVSAKIIENGYSRMPVYHKTFDNIKGILFIKDLLPHLKKDKNFHWQSLIRPPFFVHETKKINELLQEFQIKKVHLAIVVDEYGGTSGIVTLEDILEEIVGEINDEFDKEVAYYEKVNNHKYIFQAQVLLQDFAKILDINHEIFEEVRGDSDTLGGLILEIKGEFPEQNEIVRYKDFIFRIKSINQRRIKEIIVEIPIKTD